MALDQNDLLVVLSGNLKIGTYNSCATLRASATKHSGFISCYRQNMNLPKLHIDSIIYGAVQYGRS
jgi:hypothetical protein